MSIDNISYVGKAFAPLPIEADAALLKRLAQAAQRAWHADPTNAERKAAYGQALGNWARVTGDARVLAFAEELVHTDPAPAVATPNVPAPLYKVQWCNIWTRAAAAHSDVGSLMHLTDSPALRGTTLCGRDYPARKGSPSGLTRYCKRCLKVAKAAGQQVGFTKSLGFVADEDDE